MLGRSGVEDPKIVQIGQDAGEALDNEVDDADKPVGGGGGALGYDKPFRRTCGGAESGEGDGNRVVDDLMERRNQVEDAEKLALDE